jgi:hypothetical protein
MLLSHLQGETKLSLSHLQGETKRWLRWLALFSRLHHEKLILILRLFPHVHAETRVPPPPLYENKTIVSGLEDEKLLPHLHRDKLRLTERASERASLPLRRRRGREIVTRRMKRRLTACWGSL